MNKRIAILLIFVLTASSLTAVVAAQASTPKPSVPEFTINFVPSSYGVTTTDPYTGQTTTKQYENDTMQLIITNQPIQQSAVENGSISLYYNVQTKGHYSNDWTSEYSFPAWASPNSDSLEGNYSGVLPTQSNSQNTILSFPAHYQSGDRIDFQVEALYAYQNTTNTYHNGIVAPVQVTTFI
jgi:hypothetical protein